VNGHQLVGFYPQHALAGGTGAYTCLSICQHLPGPGLGVELHVLSSSTDAQHAWVREGIPPWLNGLVYRLDPKARQGGRRLRRRFREALRGATIAYLWAGTPEEVYADVKDAGIPLVVERINCHRSVAVPILDEAYRRAGLRPAHGITSAAVAEERRKLAMADWVFAANPLAAQSFVDSGVPAAQILLSSYGWSPQRVQLAPRTRAPDAPPKVLFVGTVCIRKGVHLLLEAWVKAGIPGTLELCGQVMPEIAQVSEGHLRHPSVHARGHVSAIAEAYADADVFAFPTLEEGGPLVILEAMARGLAILTSPMGAGNVLRDGVEGIVLDPYDGDAWVAELRRLAADPGLRSRMGGAAKARARNFTWDQVGIRRRDLLLSALSPGRKEGRP
jgi:glycosyltransferase involved in cell wall biosynthesis